MNAAAVAAAAAATAENNNANATIYRTTSASTTAPHPAIAANKDASKMLEAVLQHMDGIISGKNDEVEEEISSKTISLYFAVFMARHYPQHE